MNRTHLEALLIQAHEDGARQVEIVIGHLLDQTDHLADPFDAPESRWLDPNNPIGVDELGLDDVGAAMCRKTREKIRSYIANALTTARHAALRDAIACIEVAAVAEVRAAIAGNTATSDLSASAAHAIDALDLLLATGSGRWSTAPAIYYRLYRREELLAQAVLRDAKAPGRSALSINEIVQRINDLARARVYELLPGLTEDLVAVTVPGRCCTMALAFLSGEQVGDIEPLQTLEEHRRFASALRLYMESSFDLVGELACANRIMGAFVDEGTANDAARIIAIDGGAGDPT